MRSGARGKRWVCFAALSLACGERSESAPRGASGAAGTPATGGSSGAGTGGSDAGKGGSGAAGSSTGGSAATTGGSAGQGASDGGTGGGAGATAGTGSGGNGQRRGRSNGSGGRRRGRGQRRHARRGTALHVLRAARRADRARRHRERFGHRVEGVHGHVLLAHGSHDDVPRVPRELRGARSHHHAREFAGGPGRALVPR